MELNTLLQLIANLGLPTAFAIYIMNWKRKDDEKTQEIMQNFSLNLQENTILLRQMNEILTNAQNKVRRQNNND